MVSDPEFASSVRFCITEPTPGKIPKAWAEALAALEDRLLFSFTALDTFAAANMSFNWAQKVSR
jgi:hypothetical protein